MEITTLGILLGLALVDSTSFGTLLIPIWMMLSPRLLPSRFAAYLGTVALFYFLVGLVLFVAAEAVQRAAAAVADIDALIWVQLVVGVALFAWSFRLEHAGEPGERARRWQSRLDASALTRRGVVGLALGATSLEVAMMLPYLGAIGLITASDVGTPARVALLAGYVLVMVAPAIILVLIRVVASRWVTPLLQRFSAWMSRRSGEVIGWTVGIIGALLALDAADRLF